MRTRISNHCADECSHGHADGCSDGSGGGRPDDGSTAKRHVGTDATGTVQVPSATFTASDPNDLGTFFESDNCAGIATIAPGASRGPSITYTVTFAAGGTLHGYHLWHRRKRIGDDLLDIIQHRHPIERTHMIRPLFTAGAAAKLVGNVLFSGKSLTSSLTAVRARHASSSTEKKKALTA